MSLRRLLVGLALWVSLCAVPALAATTERVSVASDGEQADGDSAYPAITLDGRFVAFQSSAPDLVPDDTNGQTDIFLHDREDGTTERVSIGPGGEEANANSFWPSISTDARFVAFESHASSLIARDTNGAVDVFVHDHLMGTTERVSVGTTGAQGQAGSYHPCISADGRFVAFVSLAANLVFADTNGEPDILLHDRLAGTTRRISVSTEGHQANAASYGPAISAEGRFIAFTSDASNLVPGDSNGCPDVFVRDLEGRITERVSLSVEGDEANGSCEGASISADGRFVAFMSQASNLVPADAGHGYQIFVRDRQDYITECVSIGSDGQQANADCSCPSISADGRFIVFSSAASNLVPDDANGAPDVFVHDRAAKRTRRISLSTDGEEADLAGEHGAALSGDGRFAAFGSIATNLVPDDTNAAADVFVRDRALFPDVPPDHWAFYEIAASCDAHIILGYNDDLYRPQFVVTRGQMAAFLARAMCGGEGNVPLCEDAEGYRPWCGCGDWIEPPGHWAARYFCYLLEHGILAFSPEGHFNPDAPVDRGQMAAFIARAMAGGDADVPDGPDTATFDDVPTDFWAYKDIEYIAAEGVAGGYFDGLYHPEYLCSRDQMAVYIAEAFGLIG